MEFNPLIPLGTKIKLDRSKIEKVIADKKMDNLPETINSEVIDYKMNDGMDIGYVLMTENSLKVWIFSKELDDQTKREYKINISNDSSTIKANEIISGRFKLNYHINGNRNIKTIVNPINLFTWLIFTLKDIF